MLNEFEAWTLERLIFGIIVIYPRVYEQVPLRLAEKIPVKNRDRFISFFSMIKLNNVTDVDTLQKSDFDTRLRKFITEIKPIYHDNSN